MVQTSVYDLSDNHKFPSRIWGQRRISSERVQYCTTNIDAVALHLSIGIVGIQLVCDHLCYQLPVPYDNRHDRHHVCPAPGAGPEHDPPTAIATAMATITASSSAAANTTTIVGIIGVSPVSVGVVRE